MIVSCLQGPYGASLAFRTTNAWSRALRIWLAATISLTQRARERAERTLVGKPFVFDQVRDFGAALRSRMFKIHVFHLGFAGLGMGDHAAVAIVQTAHRQCFATVPRVEELSKVVIHDLVLAEQVPLKTARVGAASLGVTLSGCG